MSDRSLTSTNLAVGIVSCGRGALTQRCLDSVRTATEVPYHIYLIDNGSRDADTLSRLDAWERNSDVTLERFATNSGPAGARNRIVELARDRHDSIAMLDNDIVLQPGWDRGALTAMAAGFDAVQPKLLQADPQFLDRGPLRARPQSWLLSPEYLHRGVARSAPEVNERQPVPVFGGTAVIRSEVYRRTGSYHPEIWVGEDYEFALRAAKLGFHACYEPACEMIHDHAYDPEYDLLRTDILRQLQSHLLIWNLHRKLSLSPLTLHFYVYLYTHREPLFLTGHSKWTPRGMLQRLKRRWLRQSLRRQYADSWNSLEEGAAASAMLQNVLAANDSAAVSAKRPTSVAPAT